LGEHPRKKRLELGLLQRELANQIGVSPWTRINRENRHTEPSIGSILAIIQFLGFNPSPESSDLEKHLLAKRREMGWSIQAVARAIGVDRSTWKRWECGQPIIYRRHRIAVASVCDIKSEVLETD
jgi:transcriptional regulator with XRE-family HTH domain